MKKFCSIYLGFFITLPLAICLFIYLIACFITWSILPVNIEWGVVRGYMFISFIITLFLASDE
jgi:hypothetical protein